MYRYRNQDNRHQDKRQASRTEAGKQNVKRAFKARSLMHKDREMEPYFKVLDTTGCRITCPSVYKKATPTGKVFGEALIS